MFKNEKKTPENTFDQITTYVLWLIFMPIAMLLKLCFSIVSRVIKIFLLIDKKIK